MNALFTFVVVVQVLSALAIIGLVLLQHGKGADMGAAFGSGASGSLFGASGSSNFLSKSTAVAATIFFVATLALAFLGNKRAPAGGGVMENLPAPSAPASSVPANSSANAPQGAAAPVPAAPANNAGQANQIPK
ncbi:preprotein translocase subunit SecG [Noviherbaspirillum sp. UKPF54]|uniref:preprotein translocase subunit SecG n=1 Tax=Noviherbaspirillum sp. UKPF54 TaxID=2601898 RepID=UPI0011B148E3|nr:preprotein translocase subunit SecG [Noviherbaspirillum sp. UKPF54]QDZ28245.1 preprotein translocase subunit SecG [Noviherbaspirillum sp. UKPF54]